MVLGRGGAEHLYLVDQNHHQAYQEPETSGQPTGQCQDHLRSLPAYSPYSYGLLEGGGRLVLVVLYPVIDHLP